MKTSLLCFALSSLLVGCAGAPDDPTGYSSAPVISGVDLHLGLLGPGAVLSGATSSYQIVVTNVGSLLALNTQVVLQLPVGTAVAGSATGCTLTAPRQLTCTFGGVSAQRSLPRAFSLRHTAAGAVTVSGVVSTSTPESNLANNGATANTDVGLPGPVPLALQFPQMTVATACIGSALTSFAQCTSGSLVSAPFVLNADNTISTSGPVRGVWSQPSGAASLRIEFLNAQGATAIIYQGDATSQRCVEGSSYTPSMTRLGAFRACTQ